MNSCSKNTSKELFWREIFPRVLNRSADVYLSWSIAEKLQSVHEQTDNIFKSKIEIYDLTIKKAVQGMCNIRGVKAVMIDTFVVSSFNHGDKPAKSVCIQLQLLRELVKV